MPVSDWIGVGIGRSGLTSVDHCAVRAKRSICRTAISVTRSVAGSLPVVSTSTMAKGNSSTCGASLINAHALHRGICPRDGPRRQHLDALGYGYRFVIRSETY